MTTDSYESLVAEAGKSCVADDLWAMSFGVGNVPGVRPPWRHPAPGVNETTAVLG
jgi:hypothetical protein